MGPDYTVISALFQPRRSVLSRKQCPLVRSGKAALAAIFFAHFEV
jgi:hypothetical protein